jgi:hypothetical protein
MPLRIPHLQFSVSGQMARNKTVNNHWTLYLDVPFAEIRRIFVWGDGCVSPRRGKRVLCDLLRQLLTNHSKNIVTMLYELVT